MSSSQDALRSHKTDSQNLVFTKFLVLWTYLAQVGSVRALRPALLLTFLVVVCSAIDPVWRIDPDAAAYMSLGKAVGAGQGYVLDGAFHAKYPPGWPLVLAGLGAMSNPAAYGLFHATLVLAWLAAALLTHRLAQKLGLGPWEALAVAACVGLSQTLFELSVRYLRTEPLFLALSLAALLATLRAVSARGLKRHTALAGLLIVAALSVRLAGVSLLVVPALALFRKPTRKTAALILLATGLAAVVGWAAWGQHVRTVQPEAPDYSTEFFASAPRDLTKVIQTDVAALDATGLEQRIVQNVGVLARACAVLITNVDKAGARAPIGYAVLFVILLGAFSLLRPAERAGEDSAEPRLLCAAYLGATLALYLVWPFDQQERFYVPLLPLLLVTTFEGMRRLGTLLQLCAEHSSLRILSLLCALAVVAVLLSQQSDDPSILGRWSKAYALMLAVSIAGVCALAWWMYRGRNTRWPATAWLLAPALFALPFGTLRFHEWPQIVHSFEERRALNPRTGPLERIEIHPVLEQVADYLATTPPDTVVMTDVPKMMAVVAERRCIPFVYRAEPPDVLVGNADVLFYTREIPQAAEVLDKVGTKYHIVFELPPVDDGKRLVTPKVYRTR
jgi:hypothetical protein